MKLNKWVTGLLIFWRIWKTRQKSKKQILVVAQVLGLCFSSLAVLPDSWKMLFLGRCWDRVCGEGHVGADLYAVPAWAGAKAPQCFHAYALSAAGAAVALSAFEKCRAEANCPVDHAALFTVEGVYSISPALYTQSAASRLAGNSTSQARDPPPPLDPRCIPPPTTSL